MLRPWELALNTDVHMMCFSSVLAFPVVRGFKILRSLQPQEIVQYRLAICLLTRKMMLDLHQYLLQKCQSVQRCPQLIGFRGEGAAQGGEITVPSRLFSTFYLSQRPYLVSGSLRDQLLYPHPPAAVWDAAPPAARESFERMPTALMSEDDRDARLEAVIEAVELDYLLGRYAAWWTSNTPLCSETSLHLKGSWQGHYCKDARWSVICTRFLVLVFKKVG